MFKEIEIVWFDQTFIIPPDRVLRAIAVVEEHLTIGDLARESQTGTLRLARMASAWGALLRFCGSRITDDEVYVSLFAGDDAEVRARMFDSVSTLLALMVPPQPQQPQGEVAAASAGKRRAGGRSRGSIKR